MVGQREPVSFVAASAARLGDNVRKAELEEITGRASAVGVAAKGLRAGGRGPRPVLVAIGERRASGRCWVLWLAALCLLFMLTDSQTAGLLPPETKPYSGTKPTTIHQVARTIQRKKGSPYRGVREEERGPTALSNIAFLYPAGREPVGETLFPSVENSTILFLHVFKCAGTSLRQIFMAWAAQKGWDGYIAEYCPQPHFNADKICVSRDGVAVDIERQKGAISGGRVFAGHFFWDFRQLVKPPYLLITTLRDPLELYVSSQQFMHREDTATLEEATAFLANKMEQRMGSGQVQGISFIRRFVGRNTPYSNYCTPESCDQIAAMARDAAEHLGTFFVVGVVEQMEGFLEVLKMSLDPELMYPSVWTAASEVRENGSPVHSRDVLERLDPELVSQFNASVLAYPWQVYNVALHLWDARCRVVLRPEDHDRFCSVPGH